MRTRAPFIAYLAVVASLVPALALAGPWLPARGEHYSEISAGRSFADTYYDELGTRYTLPLSARLEQRSLTFYNELAWKSWASMVLSAPLQSVTFNLPDFGAEGTETGLGDLDFGLRFKLHEGSRSALALQADLIAPLGYQTRTFPTLGTGNMVARERLLYGTGFPNWNTFVEASVGYQSYFEGLRSNLLAGAQVGTWFGPSLLLLGHYDGLTTLAATKETAEDVRYHVVGPELRYRVDDRMDVFLGSNHIASGRNVDHPDAYYAGVAFRQTKRNRLQGLLGNKSQP